MTALPKCLGPFSAIQAQAAEIVATPTYQLPFAMQKQLQTNWCWAAVTASICVYYGDLRNPTKPPVAQMSQCALASTFITPINCNAALPPYGSVWPGNQGCALNGPLAQSTHLQRPVLNVTPPLGLPQFQQIMAELNARKPIACTVMMSPTSAHDIVITGYISDPIMDVTIEDPALGPGPMTFPLPNLFRYQSGYLYQIYPTDP